MPDRDGDRRPNHRVAWDVRAAARSIVRTHGVRVASLMVLLLALLAVASFGPAPAAGQGRGGQGPEGSWWIDVRHDFSPDAAVPHLATFGPRGTYVQSAPLGGNPHDTSGHGSWQRRGDVFDLTFHTFSANSAGDPAVLTVWATISLSEDGTTFTAPYRVSVVLNDGTVVQHTTGTAYGRRIMPEPR